MLGQHTEIECKLCHPTLVFSAAKTGCVDCHTDMHSQTVGPDCARCHTPKSWLVENIAEMHQRSRFPLVGPHYSTDCSRCHKAESQLRFDPLGIECIDCHRSNYNATINPNHTNANIPLICSDCHTTMPGWKPAQFKTHDTQFPIYSGKHNLQWTSCTDCHTNLGNYSIYTCISCHAHNQTDMNDSHTGVPGYSYNSISCYQCHPIGISGGRIMNIKKFKPN